MLCHSIDFMRLSQIRLLDDKHNILFPSMTDQAKKIPCGRCPGIRNRKNKDDQIGHRHEVLRDLLMMGDDGVRSRGINNVEILQKIDRSMALR